MRHQAPADAIVLAQAVIDDPDVDTEALVLAWWATGLAHRELNRLADAEEALTMALDLSRELRSVDLTAGVESALVGVLVACAKADEALELAGATRPRTPRHGLADLEMKCALAYEQQGRMHEALDAYSASIAAVDEASDPLLEARLRCNYGSALVYVADFDAAIAECELSERLATDLDQHFLAGGAAVNLGFIHGRRGDVVAALDAFDRAEVAYERARYPGRSRGVLAADRCEVLLAAGLAEEARRDAETAVAELRGVDDVNDLGEARLLLARALLACERFDDAVDAAEQAREDFTAAGRPGWAARAEYLALQARAESSTDYPESDFDRAEHLIEDLAHNGWYTESIAARMSLADRSIRVGDIDRARRHLTHASTARRSGSADRRASAWLATAMLRRARGDLRGARRAITSGIRVVTAQQATLGSTELRIGATNHAHRLAELGIELAIESQRAADVLRWAERVRANALAVPPMRPPANARLATELSKLRALNGELDDARRRDVVNTDVLQRRVQAQERSVREIARLERHEAPTETSLDLKTLRARLRRRTLVEFIEVGGALSAVVVEPRSTRHVGLATTDELTVPLDQSMFALRRLARRGLSSASTAAAMAGLDDALASLDSLLLAPLELGDVDVVVVPTGALHAIAWGALPTLRSRAVTVTPSATRWTNSRHPGTIGSVTVVAGPDLAGAAREVGEIAELYDSPTLLEGPSSRTTAVLAALESVSMAHIACHGCFRADSPMFSSLTMSDGPLTVYDIEQLRSAPRLVVLPACDAATARITRGDELMGTVAALLTVGVDGVIAPVCVVNDENSVDVMVGLHRELARGTRPADALRRVRASAAGSDIAGQLATAMSFNYYS